VRQAAEKGCAGPRERGEPVEPLAESEPSRPGVSSSNRMVEAVGKTTNKGDPHMKKTLRFAGLDVQIDIALV